MKVKSLSRVRLFATPWTAAYQALQSMGFSRQEYWSGVPLPSLVVSDSLRPHGLQPIRLICPWDTPGKNFGVGCHFLLQGIFLTQGSNPHHLCLLHWQAGSLLLVPPEKPWQQHWILTSIVALLSVGACASLHG